jgi:hypothetical protein
MIRRRRLAALTALPDNQKYNGRPIAPPTDRPVTSLSHNGQTSSRIRQTRVAGSSLSNLRMKMASQKADNSSLSKTSVVAEGTNLKTGENSSTPGKLSSLANTRSGARPSALSALAQQSKAKSGSSSLQRLASRSQAGGGQESKSISPKLSNDTDVASSTSALAKLALKHQTKPATTGLAALATTSRKSQLPPTASASPPSKITGHGIKNLPPTATTPQRPSEITAENKHIPSTTAENDKQFNRFPNIVQTSKENPKENKEELTLGYLDHPLCAPPSSVAEFLLTPLKSDFKRLELSQLNISTASKSLNATIYQNIMPSSKKVRAFNFDAPSPDDTVRNAQSRRKGVLNKGST